LNFFDSLLDRMIHDANNVFLVAAPFHDIRENFHDDMNGSFFLAQYAAAKMKEQNILMIAISPTQVRIVTHLDITPSMVEKTIEVINKL